MKFSSLVTAAALVICSFGVTGNAVAESYNVPLSATFTCRESYGNTTGTSLKLYEVYFAQGTPVQNPNMFGLPTSFALSMGGTMINGTLSDLIGLAPSPTNCGNEAVYTYAEGYDLYNPANPSGRPIARLIRCENGLNRSYSIVGYDTSYNLLWATRTNVTGKLCPP